MTKIFNARELAELAGIPDRCFRARIQYGWTLFDVMTKPVGPKYKIGDKIGATRIVVDAKRKNGRLKTRCTVCGTVNFAVPTGKFATCRCRCTNRRVKTYRDRRHIDVDERVNPINKFLSMSWIKHSD